MKRVEVTPGGRTYTVCEKVSGITEIWRKQLRESGVFVAFQNIDAIIEQVVIVVDEGIENLRPGPAISVARVLPALMNAMANSMDEINDLVYDYVPEMKADREWLKENAYDSEIVAVFVEVLKINFPILAALDLIRGLRAAGTSTNLPSTNGAIGTKKHTARSKVR